MRFGPVPPGEAAGGILAHSIRLPDGSLVRKGVTIGDAEVALLQRSGITSVTVALLDASDVLEDAAASAVARALSGSGTEVRRPGTGRCNVVATMAGLLELDAERIGRVNGVDEAVTVATLRPDAPVRPGTLVATVKVIPFATAGAVVDACVAAASGAGEHAVRISPFRRRSATLLLTTVSDASEALLERGERAIRRRLEALGSTVDRVTRCAHDAEAVSRALDEALEEGSDLLLVLGASAVGDRGDVVPEAVRRSGGSVHRVGIPVDPGNLTVLATCGDVPVLGVPGCARSTRRNGFDWILERVLAGSEPEDLDVPGMGIGGLLKESPHRLQPRRAPRAERRAHRRIAGIVLAAGRSTRMGEINKLLLEVDGVPMVRRAVEAALSARLAPLVVVLGHEATKVRGALTGLPVAFVDNPAHGSGMSTSIACGIDAVSGSADGAVILLGDMPRVTAEHLTALIDAFAPDEGRGICAPYSDRKRGNPVLWAARYFPELRALRGDVGARHLLTLHHDDVCEVQVAGDGVLLDVDTPDALDTGP